MSKSTDFVKGDIGYFVSGDGFANIPEIAKLSTVCIFAVDSHFPDGDVVAIVRPGVAVVIAVFKDNLAEVIYTCAITVFVWWVVGVDFANIVGVVIVKDVDAT